MYRPGGGLGMSYGYAAFNDDPCYTMDLQALPKTYVGFYREWRKINPNNQGPMAFLREKMRSGDDIRRAQILSFAYDSHSINRSAYHTTIIMLGETGVGKSSTINHLFGTNVAATSATKSETRATTEYVLTEDSLEMGVKDLSLGIIDTPGFNDTEGIEQDACNLACIHDMLKNHPPLQSLSGRDEAKLFPNVILLLVKATEKRFEGENSNLTKSLMAIKEMDIVDTTKNNVLVVLTNVMSFGNPRNPKKWHSQLKTKSKKIQNLVERTIEVSPAVVWVENHFGGSQNCLDDACLSHSNDSSSSNLVASYESDSEEDDEEDGHGLPADGEWTLLPDGTKQIFNLYKGIADLLKVNGDNLGLHTINTLFKSKYDGEVKVSVRWAAMEAKRGGRKKFGPTEEKMLTLLKRDYGLSENESLDEPEVKTRIKHWIKMMKHSGDIDDLQAMEAYRLSVILISQLKITSDDQLVSHSVGSIKQNMPMPENLTPLHVRMLLEIFGVREEKRRPPVVSCMGRGYDIIHDEIKARNIFDFKRGEYSEAEYGIQVPQGVVLHVARQTSTFMEDFADEEEYIRRRLSDLQVSLDVVDTDIFRMKNRGGFTRSKARAGKRNVQQYSYLLEKRLFQLTLTDLEERGDLLTFSQSFQKALKQVPDVYEKQDVKVIRDIQDFFNNWGQYVVVQAYAGGSMEVQMSAITGEESDDINNLITARIKISGMLHSLSNVANAGRANPTASAGIKHGQETKETESFNVASSSINWNGGDTGLQVPSLDNINADILHKWDQSLAIKPAVLTTDLTLAPIYELVDDERKRLTLRSALDDLLVGDLKVSGTARFKAGPGGGGGVVQRGHLSVDEIAGKLAAEVTDRQQRSCKTRLDAVDMHRPHTMCCIL